MQLIVRRFFVRIQFSSKSCGQNQTGSGFRRIGGPAQIGKPDAGYHGGRTYTWTCCPVNPERAWPGERKTGAEPFPRRWTAYGSRGNQAESVPCPLTSSFYSVMLCKSKIFPRPRRSSRRGRERRAFSTSSGSAPNRLFNSFRSKTIFPCLFRSRTSFFPFFGFPSSAPFLRLYST